MTKYHAGFDIGTDSVHAVVLDSSHAIVHAPASLMHFGNPAGALGELLDEITKRFGRENLVSTAFTGSGGEYFAKTLDIPFFHDTITIPAGMGILAPGAHYIFHMGAKDPYFFELEMIGSGERVRSFVPDHSTGTKCGGGSGILITKQCRRFFERDFPVTLENSRQKNRKLLQTQLEKIFKKAETETRNSGRFIDVGGRCGVVIQSDMIHLQNRGEEIPDILRGLYERIIKNYRSDVLKTRRFDPGKTAVVSGGVFAAGHLVKTLEKNLGIPVFVPPHFMKAGAVGAVIKAAGTARVFKTNDLQEIARAEKEAVKTAPGLGAALEKVRIYSENNATEKHGDLALFVKDPKKPRDVIIGMDGGSTTTKAMVAEAKTLEIIAEVCLYTGGKPLQAAREIFRQLRRATGTALNIKAMAYTGSSGAFYHRLFTAPGKDSSVREIDLVKDEITCHAHGVKHFNPRVDTIFELGGQDAKFTLFAGDGTVKKSRMNLSCMAGTGQTMQNMVEMLGLKIGSSFHEYALRAQRTPVVDDTCGVFTEAGIARLIALGFPREEVAAAIAYGFMGGYVNKFIGNENFGEFASAQGGPFKGEACLAALALHTGMEVHAFPHRQLFGALGAVIAVHQEMRFFRDSGIPFASGFRGLSLADATFDKRDKPCSRVIPDSCDIKECQLSVYRIGDETVISGGSCPKGNTSQGKTNAPDYVSLYKKILIKHLEKYTAPLEEPTEKTRVLIPRALTFLNEQGVFYSALYHALGHTVSVSPESTDEITDLGIHYSHSETCFPVKLAHGHTAFLKKHLRKGKDKILLINAIGQGSEKHRFCPYVAGDGFLSKSALGIHTEDALLPVLHFDDSTCPMDKTLQQDLQRAFGKRVPMKRVREAIKTAKKAKEEFLENIWGAGEKIVTNLTAKGEKIYIGIGRGYTLLDRKASSDIHELFASHGLHFLPSFFLRPRNYDLDEIAENMYWVQGRQIINSTITSAITPNFYPVRATNFNCGTDSMLLFHEESIMTLAEKPHLVLQTDGHSSNSQFGTRTMANHEVVKKHTPKPMDVKRFKRKEKPLTLENKLIGVPHIGDNSHILSAVLRSLGLRAQVMPTQNAMAQMFAKKIVGNNTCIPFSFQVGDSMAWLTSLREKGIDPEKEAVVLEPSAQGPCRFGQYHVIMKKIFRENGFKGVQIISPDAEKDYTNFPLSRKMVNRIAMRVFKGNYALDLLGDALLRTRPYEKEKGSTEKLYSRLCNELYRIMESGGKTREIVILMEKAAPAFQKLINQKIPRKPCVAIIGEIFVRLHRNANQDSILLLEKYGLETRLTPMNQWIEYTNKTAIKEFRRSRLWSRYATAVFKKNYMENMGAVISAPFESLLEGRKPHDSSHIINSVQKAFIYDRNIQGESPLSIGEAYLFTRGELPEICGIYHVGPFGCMQETAATSQIQSITQVHREMACSTDERVVPFMDAVFGDSELPNLEAEIAAFAEKCRLKQELGKKGMVDHWN